MAGKPRCLACDRWLRVADNIAAIAAHIYAIRAVDRYGVGTMEQAFAGYAALPASSEEWWLVLGVGRDASEDEVDTAYRRLAREHHPDVGGDTNHMARLNAARDAARRSAVTR
jgi:DnaJ-domain-containing protein 1